MQLILNKNKASVSLIAIILTALFLMLILANIWMKKAFEKKDQPVVQRLPTYISVMQKKSSPNMAHRSTAMNSQTLKQTVPNEKKSRLSTPLKAQKPNKEILYEPSIKDNLLLQ